MCLSIPCLEADGKFHETDRSIAIVPEHNIRAKVGVGDVRREDVGLLVV